MTSSAITCSPRNSEPGRPSPARRGARANPRAAAAWRSLELVTPAEYRRPPLAQGTTVDLGKTRLAGLQRTQRGGQLRELGEHLSRHGALALGRVEHPVADEIHRERD